MRSHIPHRIRAAATLMALALTAGCAESPNQRPDPLARDVIDEAGLASVLLQAGDPEQAVEYFSRASAVEPERADLRRGHAIALNRAGRQTEAARVYGELDSLGQAGPADLLEYAFVLVKLQRWTEVEEVEARLPSGLDTARRHQLVAIIADQRSDWETADAAYGRAEMLSPSPAKIINNWGVSKMARGEFGAAEREFRRALGYDSTLFSAKNNLAIARGLQGNFTLPVVPMTDRERATILNNLGLIAVRDGQTDIAKGLFAAAVDSHPQHYQAAADRLASLQTAVEN